VLIVCVAGIAYCAVALFAIFRFTARPSTLADGSASVTILKPIAGLEVELFENLSSFCDQDAHVFQVIFGVAQADDPAIEVIRRVIERFPQHDLALVVGGRPSTGNPKVANLQNMFAQAKYDLLVIADADMRVDRNYLRTLVAGFDDARVGAVTCLYAGIARNGFASALAALQLNDQFAPSVLVATLGGDPRFCLGSTMAVRRHVLEALGGFAALARYLADDYMLGALVHAHGYRVALSRYVVRNIVAEPGVAALLHHELRWARTIRSVQTLGYVCSFVTFPLPFALVWVLLFPATLAAWITLGATLAIRYAMHAAMGRAFGLTTTPSAWLLPLRDCIGLAIWAAGLFGSTVRWKDQQLGVTDLLRDGSDR
jgi:ceramide glucosyltransferase